MTFEDTVRDTLNDALAVPGRIDTDPAAGALIRTAARHHRRNRRLAMASGVGAVVAVIAGVVVWTSGTHSNAGQPVTPAPVATPTVGATPSAVAGVPAGLHGAFLGLNANSQFVLGDLSTPGSARPIALQSGPGLPNLIASVLGGGWVVSYTPDAHPGYNDYTASRLALVGRNGAVQPFGPTFPSDTSGMTSVAVSPDGSRVAVALTGRASSAERVTARITVLPLPGHSSAQQEWMLAGDVNQVQSLSWTPDGRRLSYLAGAQTGDGISSGDVSMLDTASTGSSAFMYPVPLTPGCQADALSWVARTGEFVVSENCDGSGAVLTEINPSNGVRSGWTVQIQDAGCQATEIQPAGDGNTLLLNRCGRVEGVSGGLTFFTLPAVVTEAVPAIDLPSPGSSPSTQTTSVTVGGVEQ